MEAGVGLYDCNARYYSPVLARFISADSIVPDPANPQALNRYAYARNSPLVRVDPSGHADCAANDQACWEQEWWWQNRWYEAHGYFWDGQGWHRRDSARFSDEQILRETLAEAGIIFTNALNGLLVSWAFDEMVAVAQGVIDLAHKVGGLGRLHVLLGSGIVRFQRDLYPWLLGGHVPANTYPLIDTGLVIFWSHLFQRDANGKLLDLKLIRGTTVHELAHIIDYNYRPGGVRLSSVAPAERVSAYAAQNRFGIEAFAENVAVWVYGRDYPGAGEDLTVNMSDWLERVLKGWGW